MASKNPVDRILVEVKEMSQEMALLTRIGVSKIALDAKAAIIEESPVDVGVFKGEWDIIDESGTEGVLVRKNIVNRSAYGEPIEIGSPKGKLPWKQAGPKTVEHDGRIYSSQAVGGVINPIMDSDYPDLAAEELMDFIGNGL